MSPADQGGEGNPLLFDKGPRLLRDFFCLSAVQKFCQAPVGREPQTNETYFATFLFQFDVQLALNMSFVNQGCQTEPNVRVSLFKWTDGWPQDTPTRQSLPVVRPRRLHLGFVVRPQVSSVLEPELRQDTP